MKVSAYPLDVYRESDPYPRATEFYDRLEDLVFSEGALLQKSEVLIAVGTDVEKRTFQGATALARRTSKYEPQKTKSLKRLERRPPLEATPTLHIRPSFADSLQTRPRNPSVTSTI